MLCCSNIVILYDFEYLQRHGIGFHEVYEGNAFREETDPQIKLTLMGGKIDYCSDCICFHLPHEVLGNSGQRKKGLLWYEYWAIKNNFIFLRRYEDYFKQESHASILTMQLNFIYYRVQFYTYRIPCKFKMLFFKNKKRTNA